MNIPLNGRVVIIDDKEKEALPLFNLLSKKRIPFNYYKGTNSADFPSSPDNNKLRVLFLDLNIFEIQTNDIKAVISSLDAILRQIIPDSPNPYLLIVWSKKDKDYIDALKNHFDNHLQHKKPSEIIFLQKGAYFDYDDGEWIPQADCVEKLAKELNQYLENVSVLKALIEWENLVHNAACKTLELMNKFYPNDEKWNKNMLDVFYTLARNVFGNSNIDSVNEKQKLENAMLILSEILIDSLENMIKNEFNIDIGKIIGGDINQVIKNKVNTSIHVEFNISKDVENFQPGNVYILPYDGDFTKVIVEKNFKASKHADVLKSKHQLIEMDITPICDYAQDKNYMRVLPGLLMEPQFKEVIEPKLSFNYSDIPVIEIGGTPYYIFFDFRFAKFTSKVRIRIRKIPPTFKLRHELLVDILTQLANQINRPGVVTIK